MLSFLRKPSEELQEKIGEETDMDVMMAPSFVQAPTASLSG